MRSEGREERSDDRILLQQNKITNILPLVASLIAGSYAMIGASQWLNQTYNVSHYYANRNASNSSSDLDLGMAYLGATSASVAGAALIEKFARASKYSNQLRLIAPFAAVSLATFANMTLMRKSELTEGGEAERGAKRPVGNAIASGENCTRSYFRTRRALS